MAKFRTQKIYLSGEHKGIEFQGFKHSRLTIVAERGYRIYNAVRRTVLRQATI